MAAPGDDGLGEARQDPLSAVHFHCRACGHKWEAAPDAVDEAPEREHHPWSYSAACPQCGATAGQAHWEAALLKAWAHATGPRTPEGLAATAANLEGHPTPEEARRTRFNAMKHGLTARVASYFPAKPGKYPACKTCEHLEHETCREGPRVCLRRTELFMRHQAAFEVGDPRALLGIRADTQAAIQALIDDMILAIAKDGGPRIKEVAWYSDKDGGFHLAQWVDEQGNTRQIYELKEHPLLRRLIDFIAKNNLTLADQGMTPKVQDEHDALTGYLDRRGQDQETEEEFRERTAGQLERLEHLIARSYAREREPVVIDAEPEPSGGGDA